MKWNRTVVVSLAILAAGVVLTVLIFLTEPKAERTGAVRQTAMLVAVEAVARGDYRPAITATGVVEPSQDVTLSPRVGGEIVERAPAFNPGEIVEKGDVLLRIDRADYENALARALSELHQVEADLQMEMGRRTVAEQDYEMLSDALTGEQKALVLREPQLAAVKSRLESARAAVRQARLDLERTTIVAPFDAHILSRRANLGSQVSAGDDLGRIVGLETYWVAVTLPLAKVRWLDVPENGDAGGSKVTIRSRTAWGEGAEREGSLFRLVGALEGDTRMARLLAKVSDPLARDPATGDVPKLMIGAFVEATIEGKELENVVRLPRDHVRSDDTAWVMKGGTLQIRELDIVMTDAEYAYVRDGLTDGDSVVTTNLATVTDGAPLRLQ